MLTLACPKAMLEIAISNTRPSARAFGATMHPTAGPPPYGRLPAGSACSRPGAAAGRLGHICQPALKTGLTHGVACHFLHALRGRLSLISGSNRKEQSRGHTKRPQPRKGIREPKAKPVGSNIFRAHHIARNSSLAEIQCPVPAKQTAVQRSSSTSTQSSRPPRSPS